MKVRSKYPLCFLPIVLFLSFSFLIFNADDYVLAGETALGLSVADKFMELKGRFLGSSYKAKLVSIKVDDRIVLIPFDNKTEGLDEVVKNDNVILRYRGSGDSKLAVEIIPENVDIPDGVVEIDSEELMDIIENPPKEHGYLLVDCRPAEFYAETHLPTAVSIPWTESKKRKALLLPKDKETLLVFYCLGSTCLLGPNSASLAAEAGYKNIKVLLTELPEWQEEGGHLYSTDGYVTTGNIVLVDLRESSEAEAGHIPGAINIPFADLEEAVYDFPPKKSAPIVLYGNENEVTGAVKIIRGWGFRHVSMVKGGYGGWIMRGNPVSSGVMSMSADWQRIPGEGEMPFAEFKKLLDEESTETMIVDVRTEEEVLKGKLKNSVHIPLNELEVRFAEIPEDREVVFHCASGSRAQMAYSYLRQIRPGVRYLHAKVYCKGDNCRIRP